LPNARHVLAVCLDEAVRLAEPTGRVSVDGGQYVSAEPLGSVLLLAREAVAAGDGDLADDRVRESGLPPAKLSELGLNGD
jgi:hypothetical protein